MTDKPTIAQADRDVFEDIATLLLRYAIGLHPDVSGTIIKSLAKHRESSVAELQAEVERLREALKTISMMHDGNPSDIMADMPIADYREVVIGEMKKEARSALAQKELVE